MAANMRISSEKNDKKAFMRNIEAKLVEKQERLSFIKRKIRKAADSRRIQVSDQLQRSVSHANSSLESLEENLLLLSNADDESWEAQRMAVEIAWDDLSQAIKKVVARFP